MKYQPGTKWNRTPTAEQEAKFCSMCGPKFPLMRITQTQHSTKDGTRNYTPREGAVELRVVG